MQALAAWLRGHGEQAFADLGVTEFHLYEAHTGTIESIGKVSVKYEGCPKGQFVRLKLASILHSVPVPERAETFVVLVDGSGTIEWGGVATVCRLLKEAEVVLAKRPGTDWGIPEDRKRIERFENFLVEERFRVALPDAQCGCWGFRASVMQALPLTALGYEIELDLLISALTSGLVVRFASVTILEGPRHSSFDVDQNRAKLVFLMDRLGYNALHLKNVLSYFQVRSSDRLPSWYEDLVNSLSYSPPRRPVFG